MKKLQPRQVLSYSRTNVGVCELLLFNVLVGPLLFASNCRRLLVAHSVPRLSFVKKRVVFAHEHACEHELALVRLRHLSPTVYCNCCSSCLWRFDRYAGTDETCFEVKDISSEHDTRAKCSKVQCTLCSLLFSAVAQIIYEYSLSSNNRSNEVPVCCRSV